MARFCACHTTAGDMLALVPGEPELGLFTAGGRQLDADSALPGGDEELILRPVYLH
jgi:hypothetical protein